MSDTTNAVYKNSIKIETTEEKDNASDLLQKAQRQADELLEISRNNVGKALEREQKLSELTEMSKELGRRAIVFPYQTKPVQRNKWGKHFKRNRVIFSFLAILLMFVILCIMMAITFSKS